MRYLSVAAGLAIVGLLISCAPQAGLSPAAAEEKAAEAPKANGGWGKVSGQVVYEGPADKIQPKEVNVNKDEQHCLSKGKLF